LYKIYKMRYLLRYLTLFSIITLFFAIKIFIGLVLIAFAVCPLTFIYGLITDQSYNSLLDRSETLYQLNKVAYIAFAIIIALLAFKLLWHFDIINLFSNLLF
jgi:hypothetical protein